MSIAEGTTWVARWSASRADAYVWTVRGVYFTCSESHSS
jgi:hypothetical protein